VSDSPYDVVVIGSGPGGYVCAIRCAQLGLKTACVERWPTYGGTCLNVGCIPSKALLESSELLHRAKTEFKRHGIQVDPTFDLGKMMKRKDKIVTSLTRGVGSLFEKNGIDGIRGLGSIEGPGRVKVTAEDGSTRILETTSIVIATGSEVSSIPGVELDGEHVFGSTEALSLDAVPGHLGVIGAGVIGLEMGSVWRRLGSKVTVFEYMDKPLAFADEDVITEAQRAFRKLKIEFRLGVAVQSTEIVDDGVRVTFKSRDGDAVDSVVVDKVLVSVGRRPNTDGLNAEAAGLVLDSRGRVVIDENFQTSLPDIFAVGDVVRGPMLAHKAEDEGVAVAEIIAGKPGHVNYDVIPSVVYTAPEIAWIGKNEKELTEAGVAYTVGRFPFQANGRAKALESTQGFVKIIADARTDRVLGVHMIGPYVGELMGEIALAMEFGASAEDIARTCHPHPSLSEVLREAALDAGGRVIHF
jgi:dihydrolipoamide dehydrogenase